MSHQAPSMDQVFFNHVVSPARTEPLAITTNSLGDLLVIGRTFGSLDGNQHLGGSDIFIIRYNAGGAQQ